MRSAPQQGFDTTNRVRGQYGRSLESDLPYLPVGQSTVRVAEGDLSPQRGPQSLWPAGGRASRSEQVPLCEGGQERVEGLAGPRVIDAVGLNQSLDQGSALGFYEPSTRD